MTLAGTRPPTVDEWEQYELHHRSRMSIKPGITGMWQASGRSDITDFEEVVKLDTEYIEKENCWISQGLNFTAACDALKTVIGTDDVEPDQNNRVKDISAFPKRLRFYHAIIDSRSLKSGEDFGKLNHPYAEGYNAVWTN